MLQLPLVSLVILNFRLRSWPFDLAQGELPTPHSLLLICSTMVLLQCLHAQFTLDHSLYSQGCCCGT